MALPSAMVPYPRAEASFFWGLAALMDSPTKPLVPCYLPIGREGFYRRVYSLSGPEGRMLGYVDLSVPSAQSTEVSRPLGHHSSAEGIHSPDFQLSESNDTRLQLITHLSWNTRPGLAGVHIPSLCSPLLLASDDGISLFSASIPVLVLLIMVSWSHCVDKNANFTSLWLRHSCMFPAHAHIHPCIHAYLLSSTVLCMDASLGASGTALVAGWMMVWWSQS